MKRINYKNQRLSRRNAVREKCLDCCGYERKEVRLCTAIHCPLYPYRMGTPIKVPIKKRGELI
jgi:hypothetical protein